MGLLKKKNKTDEIEDMSQNVSLDYRNMSLKSSDFPIFFRLCSIHMDNDLIVLYKLDDGSFGGIYDWDYERMRLGSISEFPFMFLDDLQAEINISKKISEIYVYTSTLGYKQIINDNEPDIANDYVSLEIKNRTGIYEHIDLNSNMKGTVCHICTIKKELERWMLVTICRSTYIDDAYESYPGFAWFVNDIIQTSRKREDKHGRT